MHIYPAAPGAFEPPIPRDDTRDEPIARRVGVDGLVGLIPGIGDALGGAFSALLIAEAARGGARKRVLAKMAANAGIDATLGSIPLAGDLFDFAFKANRRNARLAVEELRRVATARAATGGIAA